MSRTTLDNATASETPPEETSTFTYDALDDTQKQIRVIRIASGKGDEPLQAQFQSVILSQDPQAQQYEALSYAWGTAPANRRVYVGDKYLMVSPTLWEAIRTLRYPDRERVLWIDKVCIVQDDNINKKEKSHQVAIMGHIYRRATQTVIWLGTSDESTEVAFEGLDIIYSQLLQQTDQANGLRKRIYGDLQKMFQYSDRPPPDIEDWEPVRSLFRREWFTRRWVAQEAALAKQGSVYCGNHTRPMIQLFRAAIWLQHLQHKLPFELDTAKADTGLWNASVMCWYVDHEQGWFCDSGVERPKLADLFRHFRPLEVKFGIDRVYSILALTQWFSNDADYPPLLAPNYRRDESEVFRDATKMAIEESEDLWLFRYINHANGDPGEDLPSWVPCLFRSPNADKDPELFRSAFTAPKGIERILPPNVPIMHLNPDPSHKDFIQVTGLDVAVLDTTGSHITAAHVSLQEPSGLATFLHHTLVQRHMRHEGPPILFPPTTTSAAIALTLMGGSTFNPDSGEDIFSTFVQTLERSARESGLSGLHATVRDKTFARCTWGIQYACVNRRLFRTVDGRFGLGPEGLREGDVVWVLAGSRMPICLRRKAVRGVEREVYVVVGPCFLGGIMQGEGVEDAVARGKRAVAVLLC